MASSGSVAHLLLQPGDLRIPLEHLAQHDVLLVPALERELHPALELDQERHEAVVVRGEQLLDDALLLDDGREPHRKDGGAGRHRVDDRLVGEQIVRSRADGRRARH